MNWEIIISAVVGMLTGGGVSWLFKIKEDSALNGVRVMFINWRTRTKTLRLNNTRFFGQWYSGDTKRFDIPVNGYCEMVGFSLGTTFQGWLVTNSGTIF